MWGAECLAQNDVKPPAATAAADEKALPRYTTSAEVSKWKEGKEMPRAISDPLPVTVADWLEVAPEEARTFLLNRFPQDLKSLRSGSYEACIRFWRDSYTSSTNAYDSAKATFTVIE
jgi:hypothetical protein